MHKKVSLVIYAFSNFKILWSKPWTSSFLVWKRSLGNDFVKFWRSFNMGYKKHLFSDVPKISYSNFFLNLRVEGHSVFSWQFSKTFQSGFFANPSGELPRHIFFNFTPLVSFYTQCKYQKASDFFMFSGGIKRHQWYEIG